MDPQACYERWLAAVERSDIDEARDAKADLCAWLANGGFKPQWSERERLVFFGWDPRRPLIVRCTPCDACGTRFVSDADYLCPRCKPRVREGGRP